MSDEAADRRKKLEKLSHFGEAYPNDFKRTTFADDATHQIEINAADFQSQYQHLGRDELEAHKVSAAVRRASDSKAANEQNQLCQITRCQRHHTIDDRQICCRTCPIF